MIDMAFMIGSLFLLPSRTDLLSMMILAVNFRDSQFSRSCQIDDLTGQS